MICRSKLSLAAEMNLQISFYKDQSVISSASFRADAILKTWLDIEARVNKETLQRVLQTAISLILGIFSAHICSDESHQNQGKGRVLRLKLRALPYKTTSGK
jgi:hypothetical protein